MKFSFECRVSGTPARSLLIDRCGGVLFPVTLVTIAGYKVSLRVQSERSERLRELTPAARRAVR